MEFTKVKFILVAAWEAKGSARVAGPNLRFTSLVKLIERGGTSVFPLASLMFTILLSFCAAAFLFPLVRTLWQRWRLLPGLSVPPAASWIWGHEKDVFEAETGTKYTAWANELGPTYKIRSAWLVGVVPFRLSVYRLRAYVRLQHPDSLVTADPGAINHIFSKNTYNYHHSPVFRPH